MNLPVLEEVHTWHTEGWPPERKVVLCWVDGSHLPWCGYMRYAAGEKDSPYFVVYHGNPEKGSDVVAWCDCLPPLGPKHLPADLTDIYRRGQA